MSTGLLQIVFIQRWRALHAELGYLYVFPNFLLNFRKESHNISLETLENHLKYVKSYLKISILIPLEETQRGPSQISL